MRRPFRSCLSAITLAAVSLSQPAWGLAHAEAHHHENEAHEADHHAGAAESSNEAPRGVSVADRDAPGGHFHPQLGTAVTDRIGIALSLVSVPVTAGYPRPVEATTAASSYSAKQPRAGPDRSSPSQPRAPPVF